VSRPMMYTFEDRDSTTKNYSIALREKSIGESGTIRQMIKSASSEAGLLKGLHIRLDSKAQMGVLAALLMLFVVMCFRTAWLCDDAYITFRTADNLINGYGITWNTADRVEVYTHPLWMLLFSGIYFFTREVYLTSIFLSIALSLVTVLLFAFNIAHSRVLAILGVIMLIRSHAFMDYCTSGLENPLTHLCLAVFFVVYFRSQEITPKRLFYLSLVASLGIFNRMDTFLLYAPLLAYGFLKCRSFKAIWAMGLGFLPFILWECFSLAYYGFLFPNTAYAKLNTGIDGGELVVQGLRYFLHSIRFDPLTLLAIGCGIAVSFSNREIRKIFIATGVMLYLAYVVRIGGDFMGGRFFAAPFFCAVVLISRSTIAESKSYFLVALSGALFIGLLSAEPSFVLGKDRVMDERRGYYFGTGLLRPKPTRWIHHTPTHKWVDHGMHLRQRGAAVIKTSCIGMRGFYAGPQIHIVDYHALADPLLARLPAKYVLYWVTGHFARVVPQGYMETIRTGENRIADKDLAAYYDKLALLTRGPLFSRERWATIWSMNTGKYDDLIDFEKYRYPEMAKWTIDRMFLHDKPITVETGGAEIDLGSVRYGRITEFVLERHVDFKACFLNGNSVIAKKTVRRRPNKANGSAVYRVEISAKAAAAGYDRLWIFPINSKPPFQIARIGLEGKPL